MNAFHSGPRRPWIPLVFLFGACAPDRPPNDVEPPDVFAWAQEKFELEEYTSAADGFLTFLIRDPLSPVVDSAQYMAAEAKLRAGKELEAVEEFKRLATGRPNSPWADDAQYGACRAYLGAAPKISLSQEFTRLSIEECQRLLQFFPATEYREAAEAHILEAQAKIAEKSYDIGRFYQDNRRLLESAIVYYEKSLSEGPGAYFLPDLLSRLYHSYTTVGFDTEARSIRERLMTEFPDSPEAQALAAEDGAAVDGSGD